MRGREASQHILRGKVKAKRVKEFHKPWFVMLGYLFLIKPGFISGMPEFWVIDTVFDIFRILLMVLTVLALIVKPIQKKGPQFVVLLLIFIGEAWKIIATVIGGEDYAAWGNLMNTAGMVLFTYTCLIYDQHNFFEGASRLLGLYVLINAVTVLVFPEGMYDNGQYTENYFLSYRTAWLPVYLLATTIVCLNAVLYPSDKSRCRCYLTMGAIFLSLFWVWTATGIFCFSIGAIVFVVCKKLRQGKPVTAKWILLVEGIVFLLIVVAREQERFVFILVDILQKDVTMTSRLRIWDNAIEAIPENLLTGVGALDDTAMRAILGFGVTHAHNFYLDTTLRYGIVGLIILLLPIIYTMTRKYKYVNVALIGSCVFLTLLTSYQVECYSVIEYYLLPIYLALCSAVNAHECRIYRSNC